MIATFACVVVCIIWMWIMVAVLECKKDKKPSAWEKILYASLMVGGVFVLVLIRIAHPGVFFWMGLMFLFLAFITMFGAGMRR